MGYKAVALVCGCASSFGCPLGSNAFSRTIGGRERVPVAKHPPKVRPLLPLLTMGIIMNPSALGLAGAVLVATQPSPAALPGGQLGRVTHRPPCPQVSTPAAAGSSSRCLLTLFRRPPLANLVGRSDMDTQRYYLLANERIGTRTHHEASDRAQLAPPTPKRPKPTIPSPATDHSSRILLLLTHLSAPGPLTGE